MPDQPRTNILAYCLPWHVSQSDAFMELLVKPLSPWIDIRLMAWDGIQSLPLPERDQKVCFLQLPPPLHDLNWREQPLTWIPMWDHAAIYYQEPRWWQALPRAWRIVSFCDAVTQLAQSEQRDVFPVRYWRDPGDVDTVSWKGPRVLFYWNRLGLVGPGFLKRLCRVLQIDRLIFRSEMDPNIPIERHYHLPARLGSTLVEELPFSKDKAEYLSRVNAANFLLAPRPIEGVGLVAVDALARGCAVLAVDLPTANEYIRTADNGYLFTPFAVPQWSHVRKRIMKRRNALRMASAATWWGHGRDYFLSARQDWSTLARMDWAALGLQGRGDSEKGAQTWRQVLPALARFLKGEEAESAKFDTPPAKASTMKVITPPLEVTPQPLVSICLPHLNSMPFTRDRLDSIRAQTWPHWECIVIDSGSTDGSLELLQEAERRDPRFHLFSQPRQGIYPAFNEGIRRAEGDFIYIATADDTLHPRGLERMVHGLLRHPDCGACHAQLTLIGVGGGRIFGKYEKFAHARYFGLWMDIPHIRRYPYDAVLASLIASIYVSVTQMLYHRSAVARAGLFPTEFDSAGDFAWHMRLAATTDVLYLPEAIGTWRQHPHQATQPDDPVGRARRLYAMVRWNTDHLFATNPSLRRQFVPSELGFSHRLNTFRLAVNTIPAYRRRLLALLCAVADDPGILRYLHHGRWGHDLTFHYDYVSMARSFMAKHGMNRLLEPVDC
jgi:glycosyltransferase involved in cell wall biosynthesis